MRAVIFATSLIFLFSAAPAMAATPNCEGIFRSALLEHASDAKAEAAARIETRPENQPETRKLSRAEIDAEVKRVLEAVPSSILPRGFVGGKFSMDPAVAAALGEHFMVLWDLRIYPAKNLSEAMAHARREKDPLMQGIYIINKDLAPDSNALAEIPAPEVFRRLTSASDVYEIRTGRHYKLVNGKPEYVMTASRPVKISREWLEKNLDVDKMTWDLSEPDVGPMIKPSGYAYMKTRGVIVFEDTLNSETYRRTQRMADELLGRNFEIVFNRDFPAALDLIKNQLRFNGKQWVPISRYLKEENYRNAMESYKNGHAFSAEVWDNNGDKPKLVGAAIGFKHGAVYSPDSVGYDPSDKYRAKGLGVIKIGFGRIAMTALRDRFAAAGIPWMDAGMVSPFTETLKGKMVPIAKWEQMARDLPHPKDAKVDFDTPWRPDEGRKLEAEYLAKKAAEAEAAAAIAAAKAPTEVKQPELVPAK